MNAKNRCYDCGITMTGQHSPDCMTRWQSVVVSEGSCVLCGVELDADAKVCSACTDDFGNMQRLIDRWRKAKVSEVTLRGQVAAIASILCDQKGLSEQQAADLIGVSRLTIRSWRGKGR